MWASKTSGALLLVTVMVLRWRGNTGGGPIIDILHHIYVLRLRNMMSGYYMAVLVLVCGSEWSELWLTAPANGWSIVGACYLPTHNPAVSCQRCDVSSTQLHNFQATGLNRMKQAVQWGTWRYTNRNVINLLYTTHHYKSPEPYWGHH